MPSLYKITCVDCGTNWNETETCTNCLTCGGALDVQMNLEIIKKNLNRYNLTHTPLSAAKYLDFYPISDRSKVVSLSEGNTPLYKIKKIGNNLGLKNLYVKHEGANPTGVFKDRGSLVEITKALELKAKGICVASTGNMAASVAAYSSQAGLPCYIFVPEGTPIGKLSQTLSYGGKLIQIRGSYGDCVQMAQEMAKKKNFYLAGDYAFRAEGAKSTSFEIIEQLHWQVPDFVIVPIGCGTNLAGIWKGFQEFYELGLIEKTPKIIGVQPKGCNTLCSAFSEKKDHANVIANPKTIASAVGIGTPQDDVKCLSSLRESDGFTETASDEDILEAQKMLGKEEAIFVEPSGAIPVAVLKTLKEKNILSEESIIVCVATGTGLKDPKAALGSFSEPTSIDPDLEKIEKFLESGIPTLQKREQAEEIVIRKKPSESDLKKILFDEFEYTADDEIVSYICKEVQIFLDRGKNVKRNDLLSILEEAIEDESAPKTPLCLLDFSSSIGLSQKPKAKILINFEENEFETESEGVGPVDALVNAIKKSVIKKTDFWPNLEDFHVDVTSGKENAVVKVKIVMKDKNNNKVAASASNPDIVVASILAFVKGFNLLFAKSQ